VYIDAGVTNYTVDAYLSTIGNVGFALRWTDSSNLIAVEATGGNWVAYDCVSGTCTQVASTPLTGVGTYAVTLNGNYIALYTPTGYTAGVVSSSKQFDTHGSFHRQGLLVQTTYRLSRTALL
jgi:hypothetical protein